MQICRQKMKRQLVIQRRLPCQWKTKPRISTHFLIRRRKSAESRDELVCFASQSKNFCNCHFSLLISHYRSKGYNHTFVTDATTLRQHIEANHLVSDIYFLKATYWCHLFKALYVSWCKKNNFESKLPKAVKARKAAKEAEDCSKQSLLDPHLEEQPPRKTFVPYSDSLFWEAAIEWLISTDQVSFLVPSLISKV